MINKLVLWNSFCQEYEVFNSGVPLHGEGVITISQLKEQITVKELYRFNEVTVLGGKHYRHVVEESFGSEFQIKYPLSDCKGIGYMLQKLKVAVLEKKEIR